MGCERQMKLQCQYIVASWASGDQLCRAPAILESGGKKFCYQHDPEFRRKAERDRQARYDKERDEAHRVRVIKEFCKDVDVQVLERLGSKWLPQLIEEMLCKKVNQSQNWQKP